MSNRSRNSAVLLLDEAAYNMPTQAALEDEHSQYNYAAYRDQARRVATGLLETRRSLGAPVVVLLPKSCETVIAFMAALYAGSPYVPIDYDTPPHRLRSILDNLEPGHIITDEGKAATLEADCPVHLYRDLVGARIDDKRIEDAVSRVIDTDPIYIMYTSGSTGAPKGVTVCHRGVLDYAGWVVDTFDLGSRTVVANQAAFYFDNSIFDIYGMLMCRGKMVITPQSLFLYPSKLPEFLRDHEITCIFWVPTVMIAVANSGALDKIRPVRLATIAFCGEIMPNSALNVWRSALPQRTFANLYGPTEITDVCSYYIVDRKFADMDPLPIGRACENTRILILDEQGRKVPKGEQGEICVLGTGVALGYWNQPQLSHQVFVQNPLNTRFHQRMYRTGDLGSMTSDGLILFHGRMDHQIKLRGNRIELGDIETAAVCIDGVDNACALFDQEREEIVLILETREEFAKRTFNLQLRDYLPPYMQAGRLICLPALPHTANDKLDRVALRKTYIEEYNHESE